MKRWAVSIIMLTFVVVKRVGLWLALIIRIMKHLLLTLLAALSFCGSCSAQTPVLTLEPKPFIEAARADSTAVLLDVRRPSEFAEDHIDGATNLDWLNTKVFRHGMKKLDRQRTYYIYCRSGRRSNAAAVYMQKKGFHVVDMKGGILLWKEQGLPVVK